MTKLDGSQSSFAPCVRLHRAAPCTPVVAAVTPSRRDNCKYKCKFFLNSEPVDNPGPRHQLCTALPEHPQPPGREAGHT